MLNKSLMFPGSWDCSPRTNITSWPAVLVPVKPVLPKALCGCLSSAPTAGAHTCPRCEQCCIQEREDSECVPGIVSSDGVGSWQPADSQLTVSWQLAEQSDRAWLWLSEHWYFNWHSCSRWQWLILAQWYWSWLWLSDIEADFVWVSMGWYCTWLSLGSEQRFGWTQVNLDCRNTTLHYIHSSAR